MYGMHEGLAPVLPAARTVHVPIEPRALHTSHPPSHALSQQEPSTQLPLAQSPALAHTLPWIARHAPLAVQTSAPLQLSGSMPPWTLVQVPGVRGAALASAVAGGVAAIPVDAVA